MTTANKPSRLHGGTRDDGEAGGVSANLPDQGEPLEPGGVAFGKPWDAPERLQAILDGPRVGAVDGVLFDFRHDKLPSAEIWHAPGGGRPFGIAFPWDRTIYDGDAELAARHVTDGASERGWDVTHVYPGDRVSVDRLMRFYRKAGGPPYVDPHDAYSLEAYLIVARPEGMSEKIENPISFNARDAMGPHSPHCGAIENARWWDDDGYAAFIGDFVVTYEKIARRVDRLVGAAKRGRAKEWTDLAAEARDIVDDERAAIDAKLAKGAGDGPLSPNVAWLVDLAATVGYALAMAERAPVVDAAQKRTRPATKARRAVTDPVREAAKADILANPKTTQTACARRLALKLERDQRSMEKLIAPMFEWVTLLGGVKEKRPRRLYTNPRQIDGWPGLPSV